MISHDDKQHIISKLPDDAKALSIASARIYHAAFTGPNDWSYTGLQGHLIFGCNIIAIKEAGESIRIQSTHWFRLVDSTGDKGVIWMHQINDGGFDYKLDKPFFHTFSGKVGTLVRFPQISVD